MGEWESWATWLKFMQDMSLKAYGPADLLTAGAMLVYDANEVINDPEFEPTGEPEYRPVVKPKRNLSELAKVTLHSLSICPSKKLP